MSQDDDGTPPPINLPINDEPHHENTINMPLTVEVTPAAPTVTEPLALAATHTRSGLISKGAGPGGLGSAGGSR